jgi:hypothetical protein
VTENKGWVGVGISHNTSRFAVETIRQCWIQKEAGWYPQAHQLLIICDGGSSNGSRSRLWKMELQKLADELGLAIRVCHYPPGTSKWNPIEHNLFSHIAMNWRGCPLVSQEVMLQLIANTTTASGLQVHAELDSNQYQTGIKVSKEQWRRIKLARAEFHGEWNYTILPTIEKCSNWFKSERILKGSILSVASPFW